MLLWPPEGSSWPLSVDPTASLETSYLNCPVLVGSGLHNGSIQAFLTRWLGQKEKLSALSPLSYLLLVFPAEWSWQSAELCLNPVPSYLAPTRPTRSNVSPLPSQTPAWTHVSHSKPSQYSKMGIRTVIVCLHYLCQCTVCGKWLHNAIIHSYHPVLASIRVMIFCNRPGFPGCWNHECDK